jgi:hypothetical protein
MDTQKALATAGAVALAIWAGKGLVNTAMNKVVFTPGQATINTSFLGQGFLRVNWSVTIQNNNPVPVTINQINGAVSYGNVHLTNVSISNPIVLTPGEVVPTVLQLDIPATTIIQDMFSSIQNNGWFGTLANVIRFQGVVYTSVINIPINTTISLV